MEQQLIDAIRFSHLEDALSLLRTHANLDVNWKDHFGWTALHCPCFLRNPIQKHKGRKVSLYFLLGLDFTKMRTEGPIQLEKEELGQVI